jgi:methionyl-tRNA formyltransferase
LRALHQAGFEIALVVTRSDARRGRRAEATPSPVKAAAIELGIPVSHDVDEVLAVGADLGVVVAFGRLIRPHVLAALPMVNLHFSLLPRWRGAAPVERALLAGDERTGVCLMDVEEGLDTGGVRAQVELEIGARETADELRHRLVDAGTTLLVSALREGLPPAVAQQGEPTYAEKVTPADLELDWGRSATELDRLVRVGGAWTTRTGKRLKIWRAEPVGQPTPEAEPGVLVDGVVAVTGAGGLRLEEVQPEGRGRLDAEAWRRGVAGADGDLRLGT